jgi:osmotically-inducible protein OsmY
MVKHFKSLLHGGITVLVLGLAVGASADDESASQAIAIRKMLRAFNVESASVHIDGGTVTIEGTVESLSQRKAATLAVAKQAGVFSVINKLKCNPAQTRALAFRDAVDKALDTKAIPDEIKLRHRQVVSGEREDDFCMAFWYLENDKPTLLVFIDVLDDTITLTGTVWNDAQRIAVSAAIADEAGGRKIQNRLRVPQVINERTEPTDEREPD